MAEIDELVGRIEDLEHEKTPESIGLNLADRYDMVEHVYGMLVDGEKPSAGEYALLEWFESQSKTKNPREAGIARVEKIRRHKMLAGTAAERKSANARLAKLKKTIPPEIAKRQEQIDQLQSEIREYEGTIQSAQSIVDDQANAIDNLRDMARFNRPARWNPVALEYNRKKRELNGSELAREMRITEHRVGQIKSITTKLARHETGSVHRTIVSHVQTLSEQMQSAILRRHKGAFKVDPAGWKSYIEGLLSELPKAESKLAKLRNRFAGEQEKLRCEILDYYLDE